MAYDGIIFDFNGTLFFDSDKQEQAWHTVSRQLRGKGFTSEEMYERVHGRSSRSIFEYLLPETADPRAGLGTDRTQGNDLPRTLPAGRGALSVWLPEPPNCWTGSASTTSAYDRNGFGNTQCTVLQGAFRVGPLVRSEANRLRRRHVFRQAGAGYLPPGRRTDRVVPFPVHRGRGRPFGYRSGTEEPAPGMIVAVASTMDRGTVGRIEGVDVVIDRLDRLDRNLFVQYPKA